ncbi:MAG: hypothetical protein Q7T20_00580 [Saprospiraceae bacterium]|nr:hypothetical protein [Saprospiraceae bacterium]
MLPKTFCCLLAFIAVGTLSAQDLHIHYNVFRDSVYYVQNGKPTTKPTARKGSTVLLHVENYNNYLYDLSVEVEKEEIQVATTNASNMLSNIGGAGTMPLNFLFKGADQMMGAFKFFPSLSGSDLSEGSGFVKTEEERARQERVAQLKRLEADFGAAKDNLFALESELKTIQEQVQKKLVAQRIQAFAVDEVNHIRYNSRLEPTQIKRMSSEYMERIFLEKDPNKIDLDQVLKIADAQTELPKIIHEYHRKADKYAVTTGNCELLMNEFRKFDFPQSNLDEFRNDAEAFVAVAKNKTQSHQENADSLEATIPYIHTLDPKILSELRTTYIELNSNSFSKTYRHTATGENLTMKLKLSPIDSLQRQGLKTIELAPVAVNVFGGMRVRASVGLNFGQFFSRPKSFFVRDSVLQSGDKDAFVPVLTSFVHFYAPSRKSVSIAGSFGVGFPLGGGENLQSISFFLGPSLLFGRSERIVLNAGIMGGKSEKLSQGYQVGDRYLSDSNIAPITSVYELGYFIGVSFNLSGVGN